MRKEPENQPVARPSLRPVLLGIAVVVLLMGAMFVADHRRHLITEPEQAARPVTDDDGELNLASDITAGEMLVARNAPEPPPVRFYEVLGQGAAPTGLADAGDAARDMPLPPKAEPEPAPKPAAVAQATPPEEAAEAAPAPRPQPVAEASAEGEEEPMAPVRRALAAAEDKPETAPKTTAAESRVAEPDKDHPYTLQVASFSRRAGADELSERLTKSGFEAYVKSVDLGPRGTWYRVRVGRYPDEDEARWAGLELAREGLTPIVVRDAGK